MTLNLTRGGLQPAKIINLKTNQEVKFMFNPYEYTLSKQNTWEKKPVTGQNLPQVVFQQGGAQTLSLTLHFDTLAEGNDVRYYTDPLWKMMMIDTSSVNAKSGKAAPPPVAFSWGALYFKAIITSMSQKFTLFDPTGVPLRCTVDISLEQYLEVDEPAPQLTNTEAVEQQPRTVTVTEGERIDNMSAQGTGDSSNYRAVAEKNNVDNPQKLKPGQTLKMP